MLNRYHFRSSLSLSPLHSLPIAFGCSLTLSFSGVLCKIPLFSLPTASRSPATTQAAPPLTLSASPRDSPRLPRVLLLPRRVIILPSPSCTTKALSPCLLFLPTISAAKPRTINVIATTTPNGLVALPQPQAKSAFILCHWDPSPVLTALRNHFIEISTDAVDATTQTVGAAN